jgi:Ca-activated chloride channel homolog
MKKRGVVCLAFTMSTMALFQYDRALKSAEKGDWEKTVTLLRPLVTDRPHDAKLLYDTGVAAYRNEEYGPAAAYFSEVVALSTNDSLHEQALFNRGNAHVQLNQLHKALNDYDAVLAINPDNEKARANRDLVQKMLDQQEQQSDQSGDTEQNREATQDDNDQMSDAQKPDESTKEDELGQQDGDTDDSQETNMQENKEKDSDYESQCNSDEGPEQNENQASTESNSHEGELEQDSSPTPEKSNSYEGLDDWVSAALEDRDKKDSELNKQMIKSIVHNQAGNNEHCW